MYTGLLDVLHDAADVDLLSVRERVHVDLGVVLHKLVDEGRVSWPCAGAGTEVEVEVIVVVDDLHPSPAEDVRRPYDDRIFQLARQLKRTLAAELQDDAFGFLAPYDLEHMFGGERLEVQPG